MREWFYKDHTITLELSGWYVCLTKDGFKKALTLEVIKKIIDQSL